MSSKCIYYVEGPCEQQLLAALKEDSARLVPGKVRVFNVVQNLIPKSQMLTIQPGTMVALVFDTDVPHTEKLRQNLELLQRYCTRLNLVFLPQVPNLEGELVRCTDVRQAPDLTRSSSIRNFKTDFCRPKPADCRAMLERHGLDVGKLWSAPLPSAFDFLDRNSALVKLETS